MPEAVQRYFAAVARMPLEPRARNIVMHETSDPDVIVAEWDDQLPALLAALAKEEQT